MPFSAHSRVEPERVVCVSGVSSHSVMLLLFEIASDAVPTRADAFSVSDLLMVQNFAAGTDDAQVHLGPALAALPH